MKATTWKPLYDENDVMICCNRLEPSGLLHIENIPVPRDWFSSQPYQNDEVGVWRIKKLNFKL